MSRRSAVALAALSIVVSLGASGSAGAAPGPLPWVLDGAVHALAVADGHVFVGGDFATLAPPAPPPIAFRADGSRDRSFPAVDVGGSVAAVVPDGRGGLYVGGGFTRIGGVACANLAHVERDESVDRRFCPRPDGPVETLALGDGRLYVGGSFGHIGGATRRSIAAVDPTSGRATPFAIAAHPYSVWQIALTPTALYALGDLPGIFVAYDPRSGARLPFAPRPDATIHGDSVSGFAVAGDRIYAWGYFGHIGGAARLGLAAVDATTGRALAWQPKLTVSTGVVADGTLYVGTGGGRGLAAFDATTGTPRPWAAPVSGGVRSLAVGGGALYAAVEMPNGRGTTIVARSLRDGRPLPLAAPRVEGSAVVFPGIGGSGVVVGGSFRSIGGASYPGFVAADARTAAPLQRQPRAPDAYAEQFAVVGTTVYVAAVSGGSHDFWAFDARTGAIVPWRPRRDYVETFAASHAAVYTSTNPIGGETLFALDPRTGALRASMRAPALIMDVAASDDAVFALFSPESGELLAAVDPDPLGIAATIRAPDVDVLAAEGSAVYAAGSFHRLDGVARSYLGRIRYDGGRLSVDPWHPTLPGPVDAISLAGGRVAVAGVVPAKNSFYVAVVDEATGRVRVVGSGPGSDWDTVQAVALLGSDVYVGGAFGLLHFRT